MEQQQNDFKVKDLPMADFKKLGITKEQLEKRPEDMKALLSGNISKSFTIDKFQSLDIEARLQLEKKASNKLHLIVFPDKMEIKQSQKRGIEKDNDKEIKLNLPSRQETRGYSKGMSR